MMEKEIEFSEEYIKNLTPKFEVVKRRKLFDDQKIKFYDLGFTIKEGKSMLDPLQFFNWEYFEKFRYNFKKNKNTIWFFYLGNPDFDKYKTFLNSKSSMWISIYVDNNQKYEILDFLKEKLKEDKNPNFSQDNFNPLILIGFLLLIFYLIVFLFPEIFHYLNF